MQELNEYLRKISYSLPEMCRTRDLIKIGLYRTDQAAAAARKRGNSPEFIQINKRVVLYPKNAVIRFLLNKCQDTKNVSNLTQVKRS
jgi:hypothetical protein